MTKFDFAISQYKFLNLIKLTNVNYFLDLTFYKDLPV